jgi:hypothetical protein
MFFLTTNVFIGKYYPSLLTQLIIGCTFYVTTFFIFKDIMSDDHIDDSKYYILILVILDASFLIYKIKTYRDNQRRKQSVSLNQSSKINNDKNLSKNNNIQNATLSSEMYDMKITHDLSAQDFNRDNQIFSASDEKSDELLKYKPGIVNVN